MKKVKINRIYLVIDARTDGEQDEAKQVEDVELLPPDDQREGPDDQRADGVNDFAEIQRKKVGLIAKTFFLLELQTDLAIKTI